MEQIFWRFLLIAFVVFAGQFSSAAQTKIVSGIEQLSRLDLLPTFKQSVRIGSVSSYDRKGGNDDGFAGTYSFVRKEAGGLVIADLKGPGAVTRIWTPTPSDDITEFYFDGETAPRISEKFFDLFSGKKFPFLAPLSGIGAGGFYTYVPLEYKKSLKIIVKAQNFNFYQVNYATYADKSNVETYTSQPSQKYKNDLEKARKFIGSVGSDISGYGTLDAGKIQIVNFNGTLAAGKSLTVYESKKPGRIVGLKISPASAFAGKERDVILKIYYEGESAPSISVPIGDFFGYAWGQPAVKSLLLGIWENTNYFYLPMPFEKAVRIELVSEKTGGAIDVSAEIKYTEEGKRADEGKLYVLWRRENLTTDALPYTFLETNGRGHLVGAILQAQGTQPGSIPEFFEGDDETTVDGELVIHGTGSEDFFNGGWYDVPGRWEDRVSLPLSGSLDFKRYLARTGGYRFFINDAYSFTKSIRQTIEHGPSGNKFPTDYASVTFFYSENHPTADLTLPALAERRVNDPKTVVFTPGGTTPIHAFSWNNSTLAKDDNRIGGEDLRHLQFRAIGREVFGPHYISFICDMPQAGKYKVAVQAIAGPAQGRVQLFRNEVPIGEAADLYSAERKKTSEIPMGELDLSEGANRVMFKIVGKNEQSSGLGFDVYRIVFEKVNTVISALRRKRARSIRKIWLRRKRMKKPKQAITRSR
jgi:hypothetical protein